jgi:DNA-binding NarL/FixJ family response regulator
MIKVVIADDVALVRQAFTLICQSIGFLVLYQACNGLNLQEYLANTDVLPDIIFMDINMPVINGIDTTAHVSSHYPMIKVIVLSVFCNDIHIINMLKYGAKGYLTKNTEKEEILFAVTTVMKDNIYIPPSILEEWKIPACYLKSDNKKKYKPVLLNTKEYEFLSYCASELSYKEIAVRMNVEYKTIDNYRASVAGKLDIHTRQGLAVYAVKHGLYIYNK